MSQVMPYADLLLKAGIVDTEGLSRAVEIRDRNHVSLGKALSQLGLADEEAVSAAVARQLHFDYLGCEIPKVPDETAKLISGEFCHKRSIVPLALQGNSLRIATADPLAYHTIQDVEFLTGKRVVPVVASETSLQRLLDQLYPQILQSPNAYEVLMDAVPAGQLEETVPEEVVSAKLEKDTKLAPIVKLVNLILSNAVKDGASDIHFERYEDFVQVRYRVDGLLQDVLKIPKALQDAAVSRLKISSGLDITERRKPQDGRSQLRIDGKKISLRVSTLPTQFGEKVVIRVLDNSKAGVPMEDLGFIPDNLRMFKSMLSSPQGMILVTGPTGSGKTTTLYSALSSLKSSTKNIITVEDPIEYQIEGVNQVQTNSSAGLTFAAGLRSILRQDPNVILVGEIRDRETAEIAFAAAQTGHLLLSTLHTNDATATITRLVDIGIEPFLIASSLLGVVAQRLVRRTCPSCSVPQAPGKEALERAIGSNHSPADARWLAGRGCPECKQSGYRGRVAIHEVLTVNEEIRQLIANRASELALRNAGRRNGMHTMMEDGVLKGAQGLTTLEEIVRVVAQDDAQTSSAETTQVADEGDKADVPKVVSEIPASLDPEQKKDPGQKKKVLVVEDSPTIASVVKYYLELEGFDVVLAEDGKTGLQAARRERPDVVVSDLYMPDMDGIAMISALRADGLTRGAAILMLTSETSIDKETQALSVGADDYLSKPVEPRRLAARIKAVLGRLAERKMAV